MFKWRNQAFRPYAIEGMGEHCLFDAKCFELPLSGHGLFDVKCVTFNSTGDTIVASCDNRQICFIDTETSKLGWSSLCCGSPVSRVEFLNRDMLVSGDRSGKSRFWNIKKGTETQEAQAPVAGGNFTSSKGASNQQQVGSRVITAHGDLVLVYEINSAEGSKDAKDSVPVAVFHTKGQINVLDCAGDIAVGCKNGDVLHLRAEFLTQEAPQGAGAHKKIVCMDCHGFVGGFVKETVWMYVCLTLASRICRRISPARGEANRAMRDKRSENHLMDKQQKSQTSVE